MVIRLVTYVRVPRDTHRRKITRRAVFARDALDVPVLRLALQPDRRPRHPALQGRPIDLGEHRRLLRALQPPQGRPAARARRTCTLRRTPRTPQPADLHPRRRADHPGGVACVPARSGAGCGAPSNASTARQRAKEESPAHGSCRQRPDGIPAQRHPSELHSAARGALLARRRALARPSLPAGPAYLVTAAGGPAPAAVTGGGPVGFAKRIQPSDLAAGHLQGPARTVTHVRTTSFLWSAPLKLAQGRRTGRQASRDSGRGGASVRSGASAAPSGGPV